MYRRQEPLGRLGRTRFLIPPPARRQGCCPEMAVGSARGGIRPEVGGFPGRVRRRELTQRTPGEHELHDTVPRHWTAVPDALWRQDELGQDGTTVLGCWRCQEPCRYCLARQVGG